MQKKYSWIVFGGLLLIAVSILCWVHTSREEILGTFLAGNGVSSDDLYISFFPDNGFLIYKQSKDITNGVYSIKEFDGNIVAEMTSNEEYTYIAIYNRRDSLLLVHLSPFCIYEFSKISKVPMIIGHQSNYLT